MALKDSPTTYCDYYKLMKERASQRREEVEERIEELDKETRKLFKDINNNLDNIKFNPRRYEEFVRNKYIDGTFLRIARSAFMNRKDGYTLVSDLYDIYNLAKLQKELHESKLELHKLNKMLELNRNSYRELLKTFYNEVHKQLIVDGNGYVFEGKIGWICVNRIHIEERKRQTLDFAASKKRKAELIAAGIKVYNKKEAEWCAKNGIEYNAVDHRVFKQSDEYHYEIPLIGCRLTDATSLEFTISDYRDKPLRGKTNEQIIEECHNKVDEIIKLPCDLKTKVTLSVKADKTLYLNFIRNENQKSVVHT